MAKIYTAPFTQTPNTAIAVTTAAATLVDAPVNTPIDADTQKYGAEVLTLDNERKVVLVSHEIIPLSIIEIEEIQTAKRLASLPSSISMVQARLQLEILNKYDIVNSAVATMPRSAQIEWEFRATVERNNILVESIVALLGWTTEEADTYFIEASKL